MLIMTIFDDLRSFLENFPLKITIGRYSIHGAKEMRFSIMKDNGEHFTFFYYENNSWEVTKRRGIQSTRMKGNQPYSFITIVKDALGSAEHVFDYIVEKAPPRVQYILKGASLLEEQSIIDRLGVDDK